jgi:integrase
MGRPTTPGIFWGADGWEVDKVVDGYRFRHRGEPSYGTAESWLDAEVAARRTRPAGSVKTFDQAAAHYVTKHAEKISLELDIWLLGLVVPFIGGRPLDQVDDEALEPFVAAMRARRRHGKPLKAKTINLALDRVRRILNLAARAWRENGKPWLPGLPPIITMLDEDDGRPAMQLTWKQQREHLPKLASHLGRMALFDLNTGLRDEPLCNLRWEWELKLEQLGFSVFVVPRRYVKGRKQDRVLVCNSVAQSIIESVRGMHPEFVFVYRHNFDRGKRPNPEAEYEARPIETVNNTAWQKWRERCGLLGFRPHDMRHTVGMRLREAGVSEATRADILWHSREGMTAHYSVAQVLEIRGALELITDERQENNVSLASLIAQQRARVPSPVPAEVPALKKAVA